MKLLYNQGKATYLFLVLRAENFFNKLGTLLCPTLSNSFILRQSQPRSVSLFTTEEEGWFTRRGEICVDELFVRMNMDLDGYLNRQEINRYLKVTQPSLGKEQVFLPFSLSLHISREKNLRKRL